MEKLTLEHLSGYLSYGLKVKMNTTGNIYKVSGFRKSDDSFKYLFFTNSDCYSDECKPILHPLSDLTKEITHNGETFVPMEKLQNILDFDDDFEFTEELQILLHNTEVTYYFPPNFFLQFYNKLYEWHFDIHGLIDKNLAIDINTL